MNEWIEKSIEIANAKGYLDRLSDIYEMRINSIRPLSDDALTKIKAAYDKKDDKSLIKLMIDEPEVFPVKDSYVGFLRKKPEAIDENPKTIKRLAQRLYSLGFNKMIEEATRPIETNRQLGNAFRFWLSNSGYAVADEEEILGRSKGIFVLKGGDKALNRFATEKLKCKLRKGIDLVMKKDNQYIIGEAKFLTTPGGEQDRGFDDAETFINESSGDAMRIALLDGYIWLNSLTGLHDKIKRSNEDIMTALLLKDFINSL